mmetsp:Transcript_62276/g.146825  ORF Transcript_62276/g.146825 Transcript_62276/m.146825 type:complete len:246 (+) Transcript_62276:580-1317(+)
MQPMTAIVTPGRWPVASEISAVTVWRSKRVRPHEGQLTYSVLVLRMREPWRRPKEVVRRKPTSVCGASIRIPSPIPSTSEHPTWEPTVRTSWSRATSLSICTWWITGVEMSLVLRYSNTRREAWTRLMVSGVLSSSITASEVLRAASSSSVSSPRTVTAVRAAAGGGVAPAASALSSSTAMAPFRGVFSSTSAGTRMPTPTSWRRRRAVRSLSLPSPGTSRSSSESVVAMSLKGMPTAVLQPMLW